MPGNAREWVEDCYNETCDGAPADGRTWATGDCSRRVNRGGSWNNKPANVRSAKRNRNEATNRNNKPGFRVASTPDAGAVAFTDAAGVRGCVQRRSA
jgi:formylglycine-generating enzyme required for sulfatase activity